MNACGNLVKLAQEVGMTRRLAPPVLTRNRGSPLGSASEFPVFILGLPKDSQISVSILPESQKLAILGEALLRVTSLCVGASKA